MVDRWRNEDNLGTDGAIRHFTSQAMTALAELQGVSTENLPSSTIASRLRDFTRVNPPVYTGSKIVEDLE